MSFLRQIPRQVTVLGFVSFFTDLASEMLYPIIPLFLSSLGVGTAMLGTLEGIAEAISTGLRWVGGALSDLARTRKPFVFWGYTVSALSKPIMGLAAGFSLLGMWVGGWPVFLIGRASDRLGKSVRTAARDALIADATPPEHRGLAFGWHRAMDTCGAIAGPLVALGVLLYYRSRGETFPLHYLFFLALLPGLASSLLVLLFVKDSPHEPSAEDARKKTDILLKYPRGFWTLILANILFSLGNSSDSLIILRSVELHTGGLPQTHSLGATVSDAIFATGLFATFNVVYAIFATPAGRLSDKLSRKTVITAGWLIYACVYAGFAVIDPHRMPALAQIAPWILFAVYGLYQAFAEGVSKALVSDLVPASQRAGAIGLFYTVSGLGQFLASFMVGFLWERFGAMPAFLTGALFPLLAIPILLRVQRGK